MWIITRSGILIKRANYWQKEVGGEQRKCPAWLIYAWSEEGKDVAWTKKDANRKITREYDKHRLEWWFTEKYNNGRGVGSSWSVVRGRMPEPLCYDNSGMIALLIIGFCITDRECVSLLGKTRGETLQRLRANVDSQLGQTSMGLGKRQ